MGVLANRLIIRDKLEEIFAFRKKNLKSAMARPGLKIGK